MADNGNKEVIDAFLSGNKESFSKYVHDAVVDASRSEAGIKSNVSEEEEEAGDEDDEDSRSLTESEINEIVSEDFGATILGAWTVAAMGSVFLIAGASIWKTYKGIFKPEQQKLFDQIKRTSDKRDKLIYKIKKKNMPEAQAYRKFGKELERYTDDIKEMSNKLLKMVRTGEGRSFLQKKLSDDQYKELIEFLEQGTRGLIADATGGSSRGKVDLEPATA